MEEEEARGGAGDPYEEEAPLLGEGGGVRLRSGPGQREEAVFAAHQEDDGELQTLGGVQGEQRDPLGARVPGVDLAAHGHVGEKPFDVVARPGQTATLKFVLDTPGEYMIMCSFPGHAEAGMTGTLTVLPAE